MTVVAEVLVQKVVAEVQNTGRIVTALQPVVIAGGGGAVDSVNGQTGVVILDATDVGADPAGTAASAVSEAGYSRSFLLGGM